MCTVGKYAFLEPKIGLLLKQLTLLLTYVVTNDERNLTYSPHFVVSSFSFLVFFLVISSRQYSQYFDFSCMYFMASKLILNVKV